MDDGGNTRDDLKNPDGDLGEEIKGAIGDGKDILVRIDGALLCWDSLHVFVLISVHSAIRLRRGGRDCH